MNKNWIKLNRKLLDSDVFKNEKLLKIWIWILLKANHKENTFLLGRQKLTINKGQFAMGLNKSSENLDLAKSTIHYWINYLEKIGKVKLKKTNKYTIITILNWDLYQGVELQKNSKRTLKETNKKERRMNKNEKEVSIAETSSAEKKIKNLLDDKQKHIKIIGLYARAKGIEFNNKEQQSSFIKRNLRPAIDLVGYNINKIIDTLKYLKENADYKWTLETVGKFIDENLENIKNKTLSDEDILNNIINK